MRYFLVNLYFRDPIIFLIGLTDQLLSLLSSGMKWVGYLKSKYHQKTSFLKRSQLELIFTKNPKTFHQKLLKLGEG